MHYFYLPFEGEYLILQSWTCGVSIMPKRNTLRICSPFQSILVSHAVFFNLFNVYNTHSYKTHHFEAILSSFRVKLVNDIIWLYGSSFYQSWRLIELIKYFREAVDECKFRLSKVMWAEYTPLPNHFHYLNDHQNEGYTLQNKLVN